MAPGSTKDVVKLISTHIPTCSLPLPDDLLEIIESYLEKHLPIDESDAQRLHEELLTIYQKDVKDKPKRYSPFLAILRQLRPTIGGYKRLLQWWDILVLPVLDRLGNEKGLANETRLILLEILAFDTDNEDAKVDSEKTSSVLTSRLLELWLKKSATPNADGATKFLHQQIHTVLMEYGRKRPKDFLAALNKYFIQSKYRSQILPLLCEFIRYGPPHLYQLLQTPLWPSLLKCLQLDTSTTVISLAMTVLLMLLPHVPNSVAKYLPDLFKIYSRLLFWDRERGLSVNEAANQDAKQVDSDSDDEQEWEKLHYSPNFDGETVPQLLNYFTFLYGLYPINFMSYIRKPERYLRHANYDDSDDMDVQPSEVRQRSEPFRRQHLLHPNFFSMTLKSEVNDPNRWMRSEAADVTAACMLTYCGPTDTVVLPSASPRVSKVAQMPLEDSDVSWALLDNTASTNAGLRIHDEQAILDQGVSNEGDEAAHHRWRHTALTTVALSLIETADARLDSPTLPPNVVTSEQTIESSDSGSLKDEKTRQIEAYMQPLTRSPSLPPSTLESSTNVTLLQREIMLLKNELNFERYLKQQHLSHIGQLRTKHVREATVEAETQNLINVNRGLKSKLEESKSITAQIRRESEKSRSHSKKWEAELTSKLRALKEEQKKWLLESEDLNRQLTIARDNIHSMRQMIVASEARELASQQKMQSIETNFDELERLRSENGKMKSTISAYEAKDVQFEIARTNAELAQTEIDALNLKLAAQRSEISQVRFEQERSLDTLNHQLETVREEAKKEQSSNMQAMIDSALTALRARLLERQKAHNHLLKRFTALEASYLALKETQEFDDQPLLGGAGSTYFDSSTTSPATGQSRGFPRMDSGSRLGTPGTPGSLGPTIRHMQEDHGRTGSFDSLSGNGTWSDTEGKDKGKVRPEDARLYNRGESPSQFDLSSIRGRGGVQNIGAKKKKDDKKDVDKKEKKSTGLRGIRGFVS